MPLPIVLQMFSFFQVDFHFSIGLHTHPLSGIHTPGYRKTAKVVAVVGHLPFL